MDGIDLVRQQALDRRNAQIQAAKREYHKALVEINALARKLRLKPKGRPAKTQASDYNGMKVSTVAMEILREGKAWSLVELTIEVQRRRCRSLDDPRVVGNVTRTALYYNREHLTRDDQGRWSLASAPPCRS